MRTAKTKIKENTWTSWSEDEIKLLKKLFPRGRAREIAKRTGRPLTAVRQKAYNMGMKTRENRLWSADEIKLLKKLYPNEIVRSIADKLGRSCAVVRVKASTIGLEKEKYPPWSSQEIKLLKKMYPNNNKRDIANKLGRTASAVVARACQLGLGEKPRVWSKRELNLLKKLYPSKMAKEIAEQLERPILATKLRIVKLGLKKRLRYEQRHRVVNGVRKKSCSKCGKWKGESQFSKNRSGKDGLAGWCRKCITYNKVNISGKSKKGKRNRTMVKKKLVKVLWSKSEVALLRKLFPNNPTAKIAARLGRSLDTVKKKASTMGVKKTKKYLKSLGRS